MLNNIPVINFFIFAAGIGIVIAMIYTNIQRSALSDFINALIKRQCTDKDSALTMKALGLKGVKALIASSGARKLFGLKKAVSIVYTDGKKKNDTLEDALENKHEEKYFLNESEDTELLLKKYNYKALPLKKMILLCAATVIVVIVAAFFTDKIIEDVFTRELEQTEEIPEKEETQEKPGDNTEKDENEAENNENTDESVNEEPSQETTDENGSDSPQIPL